MRLSVFEQKVIRASINANFGEHAKVYLFGSRINDQQRGGDIDLYVECAADIENLTERSVKANADIQMQLGPQKIDIIVWAPGRRVLPVHESARKDGVEL